MKGLLKLLLLVVFGLIVFLPMRGIARSLYFSLYLLLALILILYYLVAYWVSKKSVSKYNKGYSVFVSKIPPMSSEDFVRGRLVINEDEIVLYQKENLKTIKAVWSIETSKVESFKIDKVVGRKTGIILNLENSKEAKFSLFRANKKNDAIKKALGWGD